jgi:hypothetical protein
MDCQGEKDAWPILRLGRETGPVGTGLGLVVPRTLCTDVSEWILRMRWGRTNHVTE